jgi:hypothetical protein
LWCRSLRPRGRPFVGAFHGIGALVIFGLSGSLAGGAWMAGRRQTAAPSAAP